MNKIMTSTALVFLLFGAGQAVAGDLLVFDAPEEDDPSRAYATVFGGAAYGRSEILFSEPDFPLEEGILLEFDLGYIVGGAVGTEIAPSLRGEVEFSVIKAEISDLFPTDDTEDVPVDSIDYNLLANAWYDLATGSSLTPYIGGGVGYGYKQITDSDDSGGLGTEAFDLSGWIYQLGAGVRFAATDNVSVDVGYRYRVQPEADVEVTDEGLPVTGEVKGRTVNHIVQAGVVLNF